MGVGVPQPRPPLIVWVVPSVDLTDARATAEAIAAEWGLELGAPFAMSNYSYVAPVGDEAVLKVAWNGFLMVNCGTTTGLGGWMNVNNLQRLTIYDDLSVDVQPFNWNGLRFVDQPSVRYKRGVAPANVLGSGRWG